jgi:hypothetical protein
MDAPDSTVIACPTKLIRPGFMLRHLMEIVSLFKEAKSLLLTLLFLRRCNAKPESKWPAPDLSSSKKQ